MTEGVFYLHENQTKFDAQTRDYDNTIVGIGVLDGPKTSAQERNGFLAQTNENAIR